MRQLFAHRDGDNTLEEQLLNESGAMVKYASAAGRRIPPTAALTVSRLIIQRAEHGDGSANSGWRPSPEDSRDLAMAHYMLSRVVWPATPQSITVLNEERPTNRFWKLLGPVRLVRCLMVMAIVFLVGFIVLLTVADIRPIQDLGSTDGQRPPEWLTRLSSALYVLCAAGLGAIFASLFRVNARIESGLYDPKEESSYTATIVLGMIAGVVLAMVVSASLGGTEKLTQPLLALLGGFSAPAVHRILNRLVETLEALVRGSAPDQAPAPTDAGPGRNGPHPPHDPARLAARAMRLRQEAEDANVPESVRAELLSLAEDILPTQEV
jgi:hypothetical protein